MFATIVTSVLALILTAWAVIKWRGSYWERRGVVVADTTKFTFKTKKALSEIIFDQYRRGRELKQKVLGTYVFTNPFLMVIDPAIIKRIMTKDFDHFLGHGTYHHPKDVLSMHLFSLEGEEWRHLRVKLTPTFTSGKMKMMFDTLVEKTHGLEKVVGQYADSGEACEIKNILGRFTIGSCAFGIECNSLEEPNSDFRTFGKKVFQNAPKQLWKIFVIPKWILGQLNFKLSGNDVTEFFTKVVKDTIKYRETHNVLRKDFMHLLLQLKNGEKSITENEIIAQCFIFFLAGFETSSTAMNFALYELAVNEDIQEKLRTEIVEVLEKHDGKVTYDAVAEMKYLDLVVNETLRKFPPVSAIPRICSKTYKIPDTDIVVEKGIRVQIPVWGIHRDPEYYPNPDVFNPENFTEENKAKRPDFTFLPFGEGPRMCIGLRFGLLQTKVGLISLLRNYRFTLNNKTKIPFEMEKSGIILSVKGDIWLDVKRV
nr:Cytochrome P450 [Sitophilus oryzae]